MIHTLLLFLTTAAPSGDAAAGEAAVTGQTVLVVVGAEGTEAYGEMFREWAGRWEQAATAAEARYFSIGMDVASSPDDRTALQTRIKTLAGEVSSEPIWLVLIGHGTFDSRKARFNLRGPDVSAAELAAWIEPISRPLAVINCASASGPFINKLSGPNRVIVTATKSGFQHNFARFGGPLSAAINDPAADLDKDEQTSLLEAFLYASAEVAEFYNVENRLATENALLEDTGDALGTPADWFRGVRAVRTAKDGTTPDGLRANQLCLVRSDLEKRLEPGVRGRRDALELQLADLRSRKKALAADDYYRQLEVILIGLARLYREVDEAVEGETQAAP